MTEQSEAVRVLEDLWEMTDAQQWDKISDLLDPAVRISYVHTGEVFDAESYVRLNRDYPGRWHAAVHDMVADGDRAVSRTRIYDGEQTFWVASFATTRDGRITELVEVWTEAGQRPPPDRPSA
ncbi:MAG TPA: nuclear transport factor 2 family protein [Streptosporangiaceae bacterium]|nr:nuclear transport factor 2 family protein [Streptosporangiaceae bacterium]